MKWEHNGVYCMDTMGVVFCLHLQTHLDASSQQNSVHFSYFLFNEQMVRLVFLSFVHVRVGVLPLVEKGQCVNNQELGFPLLCDFGQRLRGNR